MKKILSIAAACALLVAAAGPAFACHHDKAEDGKTVAEGKSCSKKADGKKACCAKHEGDKKACAKAAADAEKVAFTGKILCEMCNLKTSKTCNPVFQKEGETALYRLCPDGKIDDAKKASNHGETVLDIRGVICPDAEKTIRIDSVTTHVATAA